MATSSIFEACSTVERGVLAHRAGEVEVRRRGASRGSGSPRSDATSSAMWPRITLTKSIRPACSNRCKHRQPGSACRCRRRSVSSIAIRMPTMNSAPTRSRIGARAPRQPNRSRPSSVAAVLVVAAVGQRRPELVEQVAVRLDLDAVHPARLHPLGGVGVLADDPLDVPVLGLLRDRPVGRFAQRRRRDDRQPVVLRPAGAPTEVGDLDHARRAVFVDARRSSAGSTARSRRRRRGGCRTPAGCRRRRPPSRRSSSGRCRPWPSRRGRAGTDRSACRRRSRPARAPRRTPGCAT